MSSNRFSLAGATLIGLGAIVGGGILALAGVALQQAGPAALLAFTLNGALAVITALSFAELSTASPESGGAYAFARRVLSIRSAFGVGWILWSAYLVAAVLYALGFAAFMLAWTDALLGTELASGRLGNLILALAATGGFSLALLRGGSGGGQWATIGKILLFAFLIVAGLAMIPTSPPGTVSEGLSPFAPSGLSGVLTAMGATFIALQGFDLIAAVAGEVDEPAHNVPKAMLYSLGTALAIYLPLLIVVMTVGNPTGDVVGMATANPETVVAVAAREYLGEFGFHLVLVAGILSMLSALQANLLAASRVAAVMAADRVLPSPLAQTPDQRAPTLAIQTTGVAVAFFVVMVPDVATAGSAASVVFLIVFGLVHGMALLFRQRGGVAPFRVPYGALLPTIGGLACAGLSIWQAIQTPQAVGVVLVWSALGALLYRTLFAGRAEPRDALEEGRAPDLLRSRGRHPLVLVPVANPDNAPALISMAHALAPTGVGRVLLLTVVRPDAEDREVALQDAQAVLGGALRWALDAGQAPEALLTVERAPWAAIARIAHTRNCAALVLGLSVIEAKTHGNALERLLNEVRDADVGVLRAPPGWRLEDARRVLVPIGGRGRHDALRARVVGSLQRTGERVLTFVRCVPPDADAATETEARRTLRHACDGLPQAQADLIRTDDPIQAILDLAKDQDLILLGLAREGRRRAFGAVSLRIAEESGAATLMLARRERGPTRPLAQDPGDS